MKPTTPTGTFNQDEKVLDTALALGKALRKKRKADGLTQRQLAGITGVPITAIRRCEQKGEIQMERYVTLVAALGGKLSPVWCRPQTSRGFLADNRGAEAGANFVRTVEAALVKAGARPKRLRWETLQKEKEQQRKRDWARIRRGEVTPDEIQKKNSLLPARSGRAIRIVNWGSSLT